MHTADNPRLGFDSPEVRDTYFGMIHYQERKAKVYEDRFLHPFIHPIIFPDRGNGAV